jgi:hypothetical protein
MMTDWYCNLASLLPAGVWLHPMRADQREYRSSRKRAFPALRSRLRLMRFPPNLADLPKQTYRVMVSDDFDNLGGHAHHPCRHSPTRPLRRHEHADP